MRSSSELNFFRALFNRHDADLPDAVAEAIAAVETFPREADTTAQGLADAYRAAVARGDDPWHDPDVIAADLADRRVDLHETAERRIADLAIAAVRSHVPELIDALRPSFNDAAEQLARAATVLGPVDLSQTAAIIQQGPEATNAWNRAADATRTIADLLGSWKALHRLTTNLPFDRRQAPAIIALIPPAAYPTVSAEQGASPDPWKLHNDGFQLRLADLNEPNTIARQASEHTARQAAAAARRPSFV